MAWAIGMGLMKTFLVNYSRTMFYQISFVAQTTLIISPIGRVKINVPTFYSRVLFLHSISHIKSTSFQFDVIKLFAKVFEYGASIYQAGGVIRAFPAANNRDNAAAIRLTSAPISKLGRRTGPIPTRAGATLAGAANVRGTQITRAGSALGSSRPIRTQRLEEHQPIRGESSRYIWHVLKLLMTLEEDEEAHKTSTCCSGAFGCLLV